MNILLVDDEPILVESIRIGLENRGYPVIGANSARQALDLLHRGGHTIDLVITDYMMPAMNGMELLAAIRRNRPTLPVMIMTAYADTSLVIEAMKNHCDAFIEKPFTPVALISEIERVKLNLLRNTPSNDLRQSLPRIVHQINNPLLAISGFAELIRLNWGNGDVFKKYAEKILDAVEQIAQINKDIINAGSMVEDRFEPVELDTLLDRCLEMFDGLFILKNIQVDKQISMGRMRIVGDQFGLEQVFKNLFLNAVDAMDGMPEKKLNVTVSPRWDLVLVEIIVKDTGCGIRKELLQKIFDPYFTNKCNGNGLGLEIIKNVVEKHGGKVFVNSNVGIGSAFTVYLPAIQMERDEKYFDRVIEK
jgi:signal transduction histidine kinase